MLLAALALLAVVTVPLAGGRLGRLADLRLRAVWALALAVVAQVVIISVLPGGDVTVHRVLHLSTYVMVICWVVLNHHVPWRWTIVLGGALNFIVIVANNGVMPASRAAQKAAGLDPRAGFENSAHVEHANLAFLGDVFAVPADLPLANVFSVGDALLVVGVFLVLHRVSESYLAYRLARCGDLLLRVTGRVSRTQRVRDTLNVRSVPLAPGAKSGDECNEAAQRNAEPQKTGLHGVPLSLSNPLWGSPGSSAPTQRDLSGHLA